MTGKRKRPETLEEAIAARFATNTPGKTKQQESVSVEEAVASAFDKAMKNLETK